MNGTGVVLHLNDDGNTATENPFFAAGAAMGGEGGEIIQHIFSDGNLFKLSNNRTKIGVDDPRLEDRVADNLAKHDITETESLLFGRNFGVVTDVKTGPDGNLPSG